MLYSPSPWQQKTFAQWRHFIETQKIPQAILLHGAEGLAKSQLIKAMLAFLWCTAPGAEVACGVCRHCRGWAEEGIHPDCFWLKPEAAGKAIKIDQVREACGWLQLSPLNTKEKVLVIESAEQLNIAASNALLKTLEEPQDTSVIILISARPEHLLPTLRSRCYALALPLPDEAFLRAWLEKNTDGPVPPVLPSGLGPYALLAACSKEQVTIQADILQVLQSLFKQEIYFLTAAEKLKDYPPQEILRYVYFFIEQQIKSCVAENNIASLQHWLNLEQHWLEVKRTLLHNANLNWLVQLELLLAAFD